MGCYQEGVAKDSVGGKDVTAHIFEYGVICCFWGAAYLALQVHFTCRRDGQRRSIAGTMPSSDRILLERTEQEEAQQSPMVL